MQRGKGQEGQENFEVKRKVKQKRAIQDKRNLKPNPFNLSQK